MYYKFVFTKEMNRQELAGQALEMSLLIYLDPGLSYSKFSDIYLWLNRNMIITKIWAVARDNDYGRTLIHI